MDGSIWKWGVWNTWKIDSYKSSWMFLLHCLSIWCAYRAIRNDNISAVLQNIWTIYQVSEEWRRLHWKWKCSILKINRFDFSTIQCSKIKSSTFANLAESKLKLNAYKWIHIHIVWTVKNQWLQCETICIWFAWWHVEASTEWFFQAIVTSTNFDGDW